MLTCSWHFQCLVSQTCFPFISVPCSILDLFSSDTLITGPTLDITAPLCSPPTSLGLFAQAVALRTAHSLWMFLFTQSHCLHVCFPPPPLLSRWPLSPWPPKPPKGWGPHCSKIHSPRLVASPWNGVWLSNSSFCLVLLWKVTFILKSTSKVLQMTVINDKPTTLKDKPSDWQSTSFRTWHMWREWLNYHNSQKDTGNIKSPAAQGWLIWTVCKLALKHFITQKGRQSLAGRRFEAPSFNSDGSQLSHHVNLPAVDTWNWRNSKTWKRKKSCGDSRPWWCLNWKSGSNRSKEKPWRSLSIRPRSYNQPIYWTKLSRSQTSGR